MRLPSKATPTFIYSADKHLTIKLSVIIGMDFRLLKYFRNTARNETSKLSVSSTKYHGAFP